MDLGRGHKFATSYAFNIGVIQLNLKHLDESLGYFKLALDNVECEDCDRHADAITYAKAVDTVLCRLQRYNERIHVLEKIVEHAEQLCEEEDAKEQLVKDAREALHKGQEWIVTSDHLEKMRACFPPEVRHNCHEHPLVFFTHVNMFKCDLCGGKEAEEEIISEQPHVSYHCEQCDFDVHMECVSVCRVEEAHNRSVDDIIS